MLTTVIAYFSFSFNFSFNFKPTSVCWMEFYCRWDPRLTGRGNPRDIRFSRVRLMLCWLIVLHGACLSVDNYYGYMSQTGKHMPMRASVKGKSRMLRSEVALQHAFLYTGSMTRCDLTHTKNQVC